MNAQVGDIVKVGSQLQRVTRDWSSGYYSTELYGEKGKYHERRGAYSDEIDEIIGTACSKCGKDTIFKDGCYRYAGGETWCNACGDNESAREVKI